jgi:hypothetical protein
MLLPLQSSINSNMVRRLLPSSLHHHRLEEERVHMQQHSPDKIMLYRAGKYSII